MSFASDTFTGGSAQQALESYSAAWSQQTGFTETMRIGQDGAWAIQTTSNGYGVYQHSGTPASADYSVFADIVRRSVGSTDPEMGVCARMQSGAGTFYAFIQKCSTNQLRLYKFVTGSATQLGSTYTNSMTNDVAQRIELRVSGSSTTSLSVHIDGGSAVISATDSSSPITTAGKAGILGYYMRQSGVNDSAYIDNFDAVDAGGGSSTGAPPLAGSRRFFLPILNH